MMGKLKWLLMLGVLLVVMQGAGIGPRDLWRGALRELDAFRQDSTAVINGDYTAKVSNAMREEGNRMNARAIQPHEDEMHRELRETRKQYMQDRANALEQQAGQMLKGDVNALKRQVVENARNAGAGY